MPPLKRLAVGPAIALGVCLVVLLTACGQQAQPTTAASSGNAAKQLRLGYFANVTHATALVGVQKVFFQRALGSTKLKTDVFNAGPDEMQALIGGSLDAAYVGPSSAATPFVQSHGQALRVIAGATSGGAELVVKPSITSISQLKGKKLATPQLGNTQDVALRYFLMRHGLSSTPTGGGDVSIEPTTNSTVVTAFKEGQLDGAWVPEPYASELVLQDGGHVLVNEKDLWPDGQFSTTVLVVAQSFLQQHPQTVKALIRGQLQTNTWIANHQPEAKAAVNDQLRSLAGKPLPTAVLNRAWSEIRITNDPIAASIEADSQHAVKIGLLHKQNLKGMCDLSMLNQELKSEKQPTVSAGALGPAS